MLRSSWLKNVVIPIAAVVATLSMLSYDAQAQVKPFKISGDGVAPHGIPLPGQDARPHTAVGNATHLGNYHGAGSIQTDVGTLVFHGDGSITGEFGSFAPFVFTGANGDILFLQLRPNKPGREYAWHVHTDSSGFTGRVHGGLRG